MKDKSLENVEKLKQEMQRGIVALAVMSQLRGFQYGYALLKNLSEMGIEVSQDVLYPLLRRLEEQELLESEWRMDDARPRRYYRLSQAGKEALALLQLEWKEMEKKIRRIINETK